MFIIYRGSSQIDNEKIIVVATKNSKNVKTGNLWQTWILREDINPLEAVYTGQDYSICGKCIHRGRNGKGRSCYVNVTQAPLQVWKCYHRGRYKTLNSRALKVFGRKLFLSGAKVRVGSYGDPMAVPIHVWQTLLYDMKVKHVGYTHQWKMKRLKPALYKFLMASCESREERVKAKKLGFRTFRVRIPNSEFLPGEIICPASTVKRTCETCMACNGSKPNDGRVDVVIDGHGHRRIKMPALMRNLISLQLVESNS